MPIIVFNLHPIHACSFVAECDSGDLDLVGGNSSLEGYVQFCSDGRLGMICSDHWSNEEAMVVCQMLGLPFTGKIVWKL